jgi:hypothetical protein
MRVLIEAIAVFWEAVVASAHRGWKRLAYTLNVGPEAVRW